MKFTSTLTIVLPISAQVEDIAIPDHVTLSSLNIVGWRTQIGGQEATSGKLHATEATVKSARFIVNQDSKTILHDLPLGASLPGTDNRPQELGMNKVNGQSMKIKLNTTQDITNKVFEITFYILD